MGTAATLPAVGTNVNKFTTTSPGGVATPVGMPPILPMPPGSTGIQNPTVPFGGAPPIAAPTTSLGTPLNVADGSNTLTGDFKDTYGSGTGKAITSILGGLGTATSGAVTATNQSILDAAHRQQADMQAMQAAHGVSSDSSSAAIGNADFASQVNQTLASTDANIQLQEENTLLSVLTNEGSAHGHDSSWTDSIGDVFGLLGAGANAAKAGIDAHNSGSGGLSTVLDMLAFL